MIEKHSKQLGSLKPKLEGGRQLSLKEVEILMEQHAAKV